MADEKIENIDPWTQTSKGFDSVRNVEALPPDVADQTYGKDNETLDAPLALRNIPPQISPFFGHTSRGSGGTGSQAITGVGFTPSVVAIDCSTGITYGTTSSGKYSTASGSFVNYEHWNVTNSVTGVDTSNVIWLKVDTGGGVSEAKASMTSLDSDGFTLNWSVSSTTATFSYICYP